MPLTLEQVNTQLLTRLPEIERRIDWLHREQRGHGHGVSDHVTRRISTELAALRVALELPAAPVSTFGEDIYRGVKS